MTKNKLFGLISLLLLPTLALAANPSARENIFNKEKGFLTCSGSAAAPLFKQDCLELTLERISFGGNLMYEGTCLDANGKKFRLACSNFVFEPDAVASNTKKNYFEP